MRAFRVRGNNEFNHGWVSWLLGQPRPGGSATDAAASAAADGWDTADETGQDVGTVLQDAIKMGHVVVEVEEATDSQVGWWCAFCQVVWSPLIDRCPDCSPSPGVVTVSQGSSSWLVCPRHGRAHAPGTQCPVCSGEVTG